MVCRSINIKTSCRVYVDTHTSSWIPCYLLETFDHNSVRRTFESASKPNINPDRLDAWRAALDWEQGLTFWKDKLYILRGERRRTRSLRSSGRCDVLEFRNGRRPSKSLFSPRSTFREKHTLCDEEDDDEPPNTIKSEEKQGFELIKPKFRCDFSHKFGAEQQPGLER